ncbi:unnamed protein product [Staurois parvus]|uniref:Uncharacterized protein n=1 Tax=Staurois parvus TaxID=386267 RepID=A0ABN9F5G2_9NEOB|nr:unnamed protein product [Staurois parvus]
MFERLLETRRDGKYGISKVYRILTELDTNTKLIFITKWERDMGVGFDEDRQRKMFRLIHDNVSMREVEVNYKCVTRWHITPSVEHKMNGENSNMCWRGCGEIGTVFHIWWECPKIQAFWKIIVKLIEEITEIDIGLDPTTCLLYNVETSVNKYKDSGIWYFLNAAKGLIPKFWRRSEVPREEDWINRVNQIGRMKRSYHMQEDRMRVYFRRWGKVGKSRIEREI